LRCRASAERVERSPFRTQTSLSVADLDLDHRELAPALDDPGVREDLASLRLSQVRDAELRSSGWLLSGAVAVGAFVMSGA
jgi:hypothetical protein